MKLYIWNAPHKVPYGGSIAYAVADSEAKARELVMSAKSYSFGEFPSDLAIYSGISVDRPPDRVLDLPCAEIYDWSE